jgi:hypothetical protein
MLTPIHLWLTHAEAAVAGNLLFDRLTPIHLWLTHAEAAVAGNLLFDMLSIPARQAIIASMTPLDVHAGTNIIVQGDTDATKFYVIEKGVCSVHVASEPNGTPRKVLTYQPGRCGGAACRM